MNFKKENKLQKKLIKRGFLLNLFGMFYQMTMSDLKKSKAQIEQLKPNYNKYKEEIKPKLRWWVPLYVGAFILELIVINL